MTTVIYVDDAGVDDDDDVGGDGDVIIITCYSTNLHNA